MKVRPFRPVGVLALSYYMVLLLAGRFTGTAACCPGMYSGDGDCDDCNNEEKCGYDGGDCCEESCVDGDFVCGEYAGFNCRDPDYKHDDDDDDYPQQSSYSYDDYWCRNDLDGNGNCDSVNNSEECDYDGGDCCEESCVDNDYRCGEDEGFNCLDPDYDYYFDDDDPQPSSYSYGSGSFSFAFSCEDELIGNGFCDTHLNREECGYDGGDCCEESCVDSDYTCGDSASYYCLDPNYHGDPEEPSSYSYALWCHHERIGNSYCDDRNNDPECGYDGGDCCEESCVDNVDNEYMCGDHESYYCIDPDYSEEEYPFHLCNPNTRGNGYCDGQNNKPECGYDDGDCCEESCVDDVYMCGDHESYYCVDPDYSEEEYPFHLCNPNTRGNGSCDGQNNKEECGYDDGDCCEETCVDNVYTCSDQQTFYCLDPEYYVP